VRDTQKSLEWWVSEMRQPRYGDIFAGHDDGEAMAEMARVLWAEYKADLTQRGLWTVARGRTVDRLVRASVEYQQIYPVAIAEGPVALAENGNQYMNYTWSAMNKLSDQIAKLEKSLTLTPESIGAKQDAKAPAKDKSAADEFLGAH
jgi:hypothetical protein